ncbi:hypothetical protein SAMD00019534_087180 [Acytostelium subglobosum LB1]|uniref:hypothetical protein n=1 Tax=Acytostelium subglobosum LB1 TaxID=1410327 RepID=UPI00064501B3|nr:hypothetical protein SAMD00019534_087180 [Acytostelium subglobosum LB1]GAM25543.1 hypothetical protein SAMD00019534_087180 [Acytostelium subglobosum LB1]|eukprot:XP_012751529.1 hypothetical protein SAMD00019534_087180 [Acytostelium subglobosum LB1]
MSQQSSPTLVSRKSLSGSGSGSSPSLHSSTSSVGLRQAAPPKKLVIKNLKDVPKSLDAYESEAWGHLSNAVNSIYSKQAINQTLEELYRMVENLCLSGGYSSTLYSKLSSLIEQNTKVSLQRMIGQTLDMEHYLSSLNACWKDHTNNIILIMSIFLCMDRTYVLQNNATKSIWDLGLQFFSKYLLASTELSKKLKSGLLQSIDNERRGDNVNKDLLQSLIKMLKSLQIYSAFESDLVAETNTFYYNEGNRLIEEFEVPQYLKHVQNRINEESERALRYLDMSTKKSIIQALETHMLERHINTLISKGFNQMVDGNKTEDIQRLYTLLQRVGALNSIRTAWISYIKTTGQSMVADKEKHATLIQDLVALKVKLDGIIEASFAKNDLIVYALKESFEFFMNRGENIAELLAKFVDSKLRSGNKGVTESELEDSLNKSLILFRYIQGKDVFEAFYKKDLSKRLLLEKYISIDAEKSMVAKLRAECGNEFTKNLDGMFVDLDTSSEINDAFRANGIKPGTTHVDLRVLVLTKGNWPSFTNINVVLPKELLEMQALFVTYYTKTQKSKTLEWHYPLSHCVAKANFRQGKKELFVSLLQYLILNVFNDRDGLSLRDIQQATGIDIATIKLNIKPLTSTKTKILLRKAKSKEIDEEDTFHFNNEFTQKLMKIKVNAMQNKETAEEHKKVSDSITHDRGTNIDAAIVRIMKSRKTLSHNLLISELLQQLRFSPKPIDIKKRIESLIEKEYLGRDPNNPMAYNYIA